MQYFINLVVVELAKSFSKRHITGISEQDKWFFKARVDKDRRGSESFAEGLECGLLFISPEKRDIFFGVVGLETQPYQQIRRWTGDSNQPCQEKAEFNEG